MSVSRLFPSNSRIGESYSAPSIKEGRLILFHRVGTNEVVECLDAEIGGLCTGVAELVIGW